MGPTVRSSATALRHPRAASSSPATRGPNISPSLPTSSWPSTGTANRSTSSHWRQGFVGSWLGRVGLLGEEQLDGPRLGAPLQVHPDPLAWLRAGRDGVVIVDPVRAAPMLRDAGPLEVASFGERRSLLPPHACEAAGRCGAPGREGGAGVTKMTPPPGTRDYVPLAEAGRKARSKTSNAGGDDDGSIPPQFSDEAIALRFAEAMRTISASWPSGRSG